jgi:hypothetical protein
MKNSKVSEIYAKLDDFSNRLLKDFEFIIHFERYRK